jgi:hypothetical protein
VLERFGLERMFVLRRRPFATSSDGVDGVEHQEQTSIDLTALESSPPSGFDSTLVDTYSDFHLEV